MTARLSIFVYLSVICHIVNANVAYKTTSNILEVAARLIIVIDKLPLGQ
jgi:hypothetical protein